MELQEMQTVISTPPQLLAKWAGQSSCCIYRPPQSFLDAHPPSYFPDTISIGPFYHGSPRLQMIQQYKPIYLQALLDRTGLNLEDFINIIAPQEAEIKSAYSENFNINSFLFIQMIILDGCFIIELFRKASGIVSSVYDPIMSMSYIFQSILKDLVKIENQVPWFILEILYELTDHTNGNPSLASMALSTFNYSLQRSNTSTIQFDHPGLPVMHLLDLLRRSFITNDQWQLEGDSISDESYLLLLRRSFMLIENNDIRRNVSSLRPDMSFLGFLRESVINPNRLVLDFLQSLIPDNQLEIHIDRATPDEEFIRLLRILITSDQLMMNCRSASTSVVIQPNVIQSISQLRKVGITVKPVLQGSNSFLDVKFRNGTLEMPPLMIDNFVSCLIFNGVVFEQCHYPSTKHFSTYVTLLACLVNTSQDVKYLTDKNVIQKYSGTEDEVAKLLNNMGIGLMLNLETCYLKDLFNNVNEYQKKSWNMYWAKLLNKYFDSPWSILSVLAAVLLLFLTVLQALFTILRYVHHLDS